MRRFFATAAAVPLAALLACGSSSSGPECAAPSDCPGADTDCRVRTCTSGVCGVQDLNGVACDLDGTACTADLCAAGACQPGLPLNCEDGVECTFDLCDASSGACVHEPAPAGTACGAGLSCDGAGACVECSAAADCPGTDTACQTRTCVAGICGLQHQPDGSPCDADGDACSVGDACSAGVCQPGLAKNCDDGVPCTVDVCDALTGACASAVEPGACLIGGSCFADGATNPANPCQACYASASPTSWLNLPAGTACGTGMICNGSGACVPQP